MGDVQSLILSMLSFLPKENPSMRWRDLTHQKHTHPLNIVGKNKKIKINI
jgi:hypothetical protein